MADIFISYANTDRDRIIPIVKELEKLGWSVFWDWRSIPVGKTWRQFIKEGLDEARCVLVLWSEKSIDSEWVIEEADYGKAKRILIPALIDDVRPPIGFGQVQAARLLGWMGEASHVGFQLLIKSLTSLLKPNKTSPQKEMTNTIGMEFVLIPAGSFTMGSKTGSEDEKPQHDVKILQSFYLQTTQITQRQWKKVMDDNPSEFKDRGDDCPVDSVSWDDVQKFIKKLNDMEGTDKYRLPSEAEWEYGCRAGSTTVFSFGNYAEQLGVYAWFDLNSDDKTHPVGEKKPNAWGLYDMHGNVYEWVEDDWHGNYDKAPSDGRPWVEKPRGPHRVIRGGSWGNGAHNCRSATRDDNAPDVCNTYIGFRLARSVALGS